MRFHRGGLSGLFDALTELVLERAARERFDLKHAKKADKREKKDARRAKRQGHQLSAPSAKSAVHPLDASVADLPTLGAPNLAGFPGMPGMASASTSPGAPVVPGTPAAVIASLEESARGFAETEDELRKAMGGVLPGEAAPGQKTQGDNAPGLAGGATAQPFAPPAKHAPLDETASRIQKALAILSDVPWNIEPNHDLLVIHAPDDRRALAKEDARVLTEAFGVPQESPWMTILPPRRAFFLDQIELRVRSKLASLQEQYPEEWSSCQKMRDQTRVVDEFLSQVVERKKNNATASASAAPTAITTSEPAASVSDLQSALDAGDESDDADPLASSASHASPAAAPVVAASKNASHATV